MKGGVGKTTISANLAAYFAAKGKRTILIDFDYQGSLSQTILGHLGETSFQMSAHHLLDGKRPPADLLLLEPRRRLRDNQRDLVRFYSATYPFATIENRLMAEWLQDDRDDVRYELAKVLSDPSVVGEFDIAIVDCPPRITTATINALTAASHVLIPSQPDGLSMPAAIYFSAQLMRMRELVFPNLKLLGLVPSLTQQSTSLKESELELLRDASEELRKIWRLDGVDPVLYDSYIPRTGPIRDAAGTGIAYLRNAPAKAIFERLGRNIEERLS